MADFILPKESLLRIDLYEATRTVVAAAKRYQECPASEDETAELVLDEATSALVVAFEAVHGPVNAGKGGR